MVLDAAAKHESTSLNDNSVKGPDLLNRLIGLLIRFKKGKYAVLADIEQIFHQIFVLEKDNCPNWSLKKTALDQKDTYPETIILKILDKFYMDDYLDSFSNKDSTISTIKDVICILKISGFRLYKWIANDREILRSLPVNEVLSKIVNLELDEIEIE